jgi:hypothetical protein
MASDCICSAPMGHSGRIFPLGRYCRTRVLHDAHKAISELRQQMEVKINYGEIACPPS